ncbi:hypothetical protein OH76DRAFT_124497 [Lentinus brumalis]|uniref:Uncharacterized protein n=1 Tax=Lentinus brumalis TaxID=2498619 RepID=A0A371DJQ0_9APHY|nr:hypothetical protein OH76DRAFT_124497 [Polyporus brumalis]
MRLYLLVDYLREAESCLRSEGWTDAKSSWAVAMRSSYRSCWDPHTWPGIAPAVDDRDEAHYPSLPQLDDSLSGSGDTTSFKSSICLWTARHSHPHRSPPHRRQTSSNFILIGICGCFARTA